MLYDVVSVLVLQQLLCVGVKLVQDRTRLFRIAVLQNALDHTATVRVGRQSGHLETERKSKTFSNENVVYKEYSTFTRPDQIFTCPWNESMMN